MDYIEYKSILWKKYQGILIPNEADQPNIRLNTRDKKYLLKKSNCYIIRWPSNWDIKHETEWWYVICDRFYNIEEYSSKRRYEIKKGLKLNYVRKINKDEVIEQGYDTYNLAMKSYKTPQIIKSREEFNKSLRDYSDKTWNFWGVYSRKNDKLVGYSQNLVTDKSCEYKVMKFSPFYLKDNISYALIYEMNKYYLSDNLVDYVNDGARSISHESNIQDFLIQKLKFRKAYCNLNIYYRKDIFVLVKFLFLFRNILKLTPFFFIKRLIVLIDQEKILRSFR